MHRKLEDAKSRGLDAAEVRRDAQDGVEVAVSKTGCGVTQAGLARVYR